MINDKYDIETCTWCNGEGKDLAFKGQTHNQPECKRCEGSGKVYVTSEQATTKKRRKYMGPVPKPIPLINPVDIKWEGSRGTFEIASIQSPDIIEPKKRRGRPPKVAI